MGVIKGDTRRLEYSSYSISMSMGFSSHIDPNIQDSLL